MDRFTADLHIHSRFSRATSKRLTLRNLAAWGRVKGLDVLGTGDFTHPGWMEEIQDQLTEDGDGLLTLKDARDLEAEIPGLERPLAGQTRFILQTEISSIYKRGGKVRKVHNLVYMPTIEAAERLTRRLEEVGNLASDGRPILGLDSRHLLEMVLETDPLAFLVPAHVWTPWFSLFGSKSGFDTIEECFGDLSRHIFALETGLSSDPDMNWRWSALDRFRLISNSDAHSGEKLGREANLFQGGASYEGIYRALRGEGLGHRFLGTIEFFPEEGKYHLDGHRKCGVVLDPEETRARGGCCPVCGKPVTLGVHHRVMELADRDAPARPAGHPGFTSLIPLKEVLGELLDCGPNTKKVAGAYNRLIADFGSELSVLRRAPLDDLKRHGPLLAEALGRMREGQVYRRPGFDGEYGVISVFTPQERERLLGRATLVEMPKAKQPTRKAPTPEPDVEDAATMDEAAVGAAPLAYNPAQQRAIDAGPGPVLVLAGPGTGKTQTLTGRILRLLSQDVEADSILALTFTRRAAGELNLRLARLLGEQADLPRADTLHALGYEFWDRAYDGPPVVLGDEAALRVFAEATPELTKARRRQFWDEMQLARETLAPLEGEPAECARRYARLKHSWNLVDYADLLEFLVEQVEGEQFAAPWAHVLVDEVQDLSPLQLRAVRGLAGKDGEGFFAIGDPDQSIYGFRGAAGDAEARLRAFWPKLKTVRLAENYRSGQAILDLSGTLFPDNPVLAAATDTPARAHIFQAPDAAREAAWVAERIKRLIGATSHSLADATGHGDVSPGDVAVLVRFKGLIPALEGALKRHGIPCAVPEAAAFWDDPRVEAILLAAGRFLGVSAGEDEDLPDFPDKALAQGPVGLAAYMGDMPPFDQLFWESRAFRQLKRAFKEHGGWSRLLSWINLQTDLDKVRRSAEKVHIMTLHAAKGLEFHTVFLPALEDGILPFAGPEALTGRVAPGGVQALDDAEERRLFYVGCTRAMRELYLSHAARRPLYGRTLQLPPSRFLAELPTALLTRSALTAHTVRKARQMSLLD